jgi:hypothetical protein
MAFSKKPLSNLDYLIAPPQSAPAASQSSSSRSASRAIEETAVALGGPILATLNKDPQGQKTAYELVDALNIRLEDLFAVCDVLDSQFHWITVDKSDPKGNYKISLTDRGRDYARKTASLRAV